VPHRAGGAHPTLSLSVADWSEREEVPLNAKQWEDDWDDDSVADDFSKQLRAELEKQPAPATKAATS
jgi:hypothetical protein